MSDKPLCPYCGAHNGHPDGVEMIPQRESMGMRMGYDYMYCPRCAARGPGVYTQDGKFAGKQKAAKGVAVCTDPLELKQDMKQRSDRP